MESPSDDTPWLTSDQARRRQPHRAHTDTRTLATRRVFLVYPSSSQEARCTDVSSPNPQHDRAPIPTDTTSPFSPLQPITHDIACTACGYNLRGLSGDPIRCPECFHAHPRESLELEIGRVGSVRELQAAADALLLGILVAGFGLILAPCGGLLLVVYALILIGPAMSDMKQRFRGQRGWAPLLWQFVALTVAVPLCFATLTIGVAALGGWLGRWLGDANEWITAASAIAGLALGTVTLARLKLTSALRTRQNATFERLCRLLPPRDASVASETNGNR